MVLVLKVYTETKEEMVMHKSSDVLWVNINLRLISILGKLVMQKQIFPKAVLELGIQDGRLTVG